MPTAEMTLPSCRSTSPHAEAPQNPSGRIGWYVIDDSHAR
jgi:hypothetical protein